jgi:FtsP/CotA-like multicopper oxidase with cupredoxin domain
VLRVNVTGVQEPAQYLPTQWPDMPPFLEDLPLNGKRRWVAFSMTNNSAAKSTTGTPRTRFFINGLQYGDDCAGETLGLGQSEVWRITNNSSPQHPYHIHTNPFQLLSRRWRSASNGNVIPLQTQVLEAPYPWFDVIALKPGALRRLSETRVVYRPDDYTGATVIHCHFLGHEDRGMMTNIQILCPKRADAPDSISFGMPATNGLADDCLVSPLDAKPLLQCPAVFVEEPEALSFR